MDLTVVPPACPHRAAALLLGGVPGQNVIAEVCIVEVVIALFPLIWQRRTGGRTGGSRTGGRTGGRLVGRLVGGSFGGIVACK